MTRGRPTKYTPEIGDAICARLLSGETLRRICSDDDMPAESTVRGWALDNQGGFSAQYARSREIGYLAMADDVLEIADDRGGDYVLRDGATMMDSDAVARARLRVDTRKWLLSKALPKVYGDKLAVGGDKDMDPIQTEEVGAGASKLSAFIETLAERSRAASDPDAD